MLLLAKIISLFSKQEASSTQFWLAERCGLAPESIYNLFLLNPSFKNTDLEALARFLEKNTLIIRALILMNAIFAATESWLCYFLVLTLALSYNPHFFNIRIGPT